MDRFRRIRTQDTGQRHYLGVPFARQLDTDECEAIAARLEAATIEREHRTYQIDTTAVDVTPEYALVEYHLTSDAELNPRDIRTRLYQIIGEWHSEHGPLSGRTRLGEGRESGTFAPAAIDLPDTRDVVEGRLSDKHAGDDVDESRRDRYYTLAYPRRPLTDEEVSLLDHAADQPVVVTNRYVALLDVTRPGSNTPYRTSLATLRESVADVGRVAAGAEIADRFLYKTRERGSLPTVGVDDETIREALVARAEQQTPHQPDDVADSSEVNA